MPGRIFSSQVSIDIDHKRIPSHIRAYLVVKFIVNHFQSNKIMLFIVKKGHEAFNEMIYHYYFTERILKVSCHVALKLW